MNFSSSSPRTNLLEAPPTFLYILGRAWEAGICTPAPEVLFRFRIGDNVRDRLRLTVCFLFDPRALNPLISESVRIF